MKKTSKTPSKSNSPTTTNHKGSDPISKAEYKTGNILSYAVAVIGIYLVVKGGFVSGGLFLAGSAVLMPRFPFFSWIPSPAGWVLIAVGFSALP